MAKEKDFLLAEIGQKIKKQEMSIKNSTFSDSSNFGNKLEKNGGDMQLKIERTELRIKELAQENAYLEEKTGKQSGIVG